MDMSSTNIKDHQRISKSSRDPSNTMMMIKSKSNTNNTGPKNTSLNYLYSTNNNNSQTSYEDQEDYMINAFSWPPRSYSCSFCKREFRSAQALGGHMNVHRKDRARLRQSPPSDIISGQYGSSTTSSTTFLNLNLNHSPNPNSSMNMITTSSLCSFTNSQPTRSSLVSSPYSSHNNNDVPSKKRPGRLTNDLDHIQYPLVKGRSVCGVREEQLHEGFAGNKDVTNYRNLNSKIKESKTSTSVRLDLEIGLLRGHDSEIGRDLDLELRLGYSN